MNREQRRKFIRTQKNTKSIKVPNFNDRENYMISQTLEELGKNKDGFTFEDFKKLMLEKGFGENVH